MGPRFPGQLDATLDLAVLLTEVAVKSAAAANQRLRRARRTRKGETLKPGVDTPLWNELVLAVKGQLTRRGEKVRLARLLGVPRQRLYELLNRHRHLPDAERTLLLLAWLHARQHGRDLT